MSQSTDPQLTWSDIGVSHGSESITCCVGESTSCTPSATLCLFLGADAGLVEDPPSFFSHYRYPLDLLIRGGARVLAMPSSWEDLRELVQRIRFGEDAFGEAVARVRAVTDHVVQGGLAAEGRIVVIGTSRYGWLALAAMAHIPEIGGAVATQTVSYWSHLVEFKGLETDPIIQRYDLRRLAHKMPPRSVLVQVGYYDERVGTERGRELAARLDEAYATAGLPERCTFEILPFKGHSESDPSEPLVSIADWLAGQGFLLDET